jgi:hypothetical protein
MTHQNFTLHRANSAMDTFAGSLVGSIRVCRRLLTSPFVAVAKGLVAIPGAIGNAAGMAYVDPFMPSGKRPK